MSALATVPRDDRTFGELLVRRLEKQAASACFEDPKETAGDFLRRMLKTTVIDLAASADVIFDPVEMAQRIHEILNSHPSWMTPLEGSEGEWVTYPESLKGFFDKQSYIDLGYEGDRPSFPHNLLDGLLSDLVWYFTNVQTWLRRTRRRSTDLLDFDELAKTQATRWNNFRKWQLDNRGLPDDDGIFEAFINMDEVEFSRSKWQIECETRRLRRETVREGTHHGTFEEYAIAVQIRLWERGFKIEFQLLKSVHEQDEVTTWIEYFAYECWWCDFYSGQRKDAQLDLNEAFAMFGESGAKQEEDTILSLCTPEALEKLEEDEEDARQRLDSARMEVTKARSLTSKTVEKPSRSNPTRRTRLGKALAQMQDAKARFDLIECRGRHIRYIRECSEKVGEKEALVWQQILVMRWVLKQMALMIYYEDEKKARLRKARAEKVRAYEPRAKAIRIGELVAGNQPRKRQWRQVVGLDEVGESSKKAQMSDTTTEGDVYDLAYAAVKAMENYTQPHTACGPDCHACLWESRNKVDETKNPFGTDDDVETKHEERPFKTEQSSGARSRAEEEVSNLPNLDDIIDPNIWD